MKQLDYMREEHSKILRSQSSDTTQQRKVFELQKQYDDLYALNLDNLMRITLLCSEVEALRVSLQKKEIEIEELKKY